MHPYILSITAFTTICALFGIAVKRHYEAKAEKTYQRAGRRFFAFRYLTRTIDFCIKLE